MVKRRCLAVLLGMAMVCAAAGCGQKGNVEEAAAESSEHATTSKVTLTEGKYSDEKLDDTWDEKNAVYLKLEGDKIDVQAVGESGTDGVKTEGSTATISQAGTYVLSGSLEDGQIVVDTEKDVYVKLVLNGVEIGCADSAPVYCKGGNLIITLAAGTENTITDGESYVFAGEQEDEPSAAVFAKDDLTFNGTGALTVNGNYNHAIQCKDDLKFVSGTYVLSAVDDAIVGRDSVSVRDGNFTIESGDDGIKATNIDDPEKGYILIENGTFQITAGGDGIQAETLLRVNDGKLDIVTGGGSAEAATPGEMQKGEAPGMREKDESEMPGEAPEVPEGVEERQDGEKPNGVEEWQAGERPDGAEERQNGERLEGAEERKDGERPEGAEERQDGERPEGDALQRAGENPDEDGTREADGMPENGGKPEGRADFPEEGETPQGNVQPGVNTPEKAAGISENEEEEPTSTKALKSYVELVIAGGEFALDSCDDALHSNQNISIEGGTFTIQAGDDGVHADKTLTIDGGSIDIAQSYEGLEGFDIVINAGDIKVVSSDDGVNAAGDAKSAANSESDSGQQPDKADGELDKADGESDKADGESENTDAGPGNTAPGSQFQREQGGFMAGEDQGATLTVNGGSLWVNAEGDGLDANGDIFINGGTVTVHGPVSGGDGTLDYASSCKITGGMFLGAGSVGMAQSPSEDSTQPSIVGTLDQAVESGTTISVKTVDGEIIASVVTEKRAQWYAVSAPGLKEGESYIVSVGEEEQTVEITDVVTEIR